MFPIRDKSMTEGALAATASGTPVRLGLSPLATRTHRASH